MMASRYPSEMPRSDRHEVRYFGKNVMLAERLHDEGYRTAAVSSHFLFDRMLGWVDGIDRFVMARAAGTAPRGAHIHHRHSSPPLADAAVKLLQHPHNAFSGCS